MVSTSSVDPWDLDAARFPDHGTAREALEFLIRYAILAPSSHNTQPWKFAIRGDAIRVSADPSRWLRIADPDQRELYISTGCAIENLMIAARHFGYSPQIHYFPDEEDAYGVAEILLSSRTAGRGEPELIAAIPRRQTNHRLFQARPLPNRLQQRMQEQCEEEGIQIFLTEDTEIRRQVEDLAMRADALQFADPAFRHELGQWIGRGVFGTPWLLSKLGQMAVTFLDMGAAVGRKDVRRIESAPVFGLITSSADDRTSQVKAGRVFEAMYLAATMEGVSLQPMSQLCEITEIRGQLAQLAPQAGLYPQQPFRLGYAEPESAHTPRRPLAEFLEQGAA